MLRSHLKFLQQCEDFECSRPFTKLRNNRWCWQQLLLKHSLLLRSLLQTGGLSLMFVPSRPERTPRVLTAPLEKAPGNESRACEKF